MRCCAVLDTNVLVSALLSAHEDAATVQVMEKVLSGEIIPVFSGRILEEYREVLHRKKFGFSPDTVEYLIAAIRTLGMMADPSPAAVVLPDPKDLPFYEVVMEQQDDHTYLVTGNLRHFPKEPFIVTPRQLLDLLNEA